MLTAIAEDVWQPLANAHRERAAAFTADRLDRRSRGLSHPVEDFLFDYYSYEPAKLARWHPGAGRVLGGSGAQDYLRLRTYVEYVNGVGADLERLRRRRDGLEWIRALLGRTAVRRPHLDCFGLHEWAMVYRTQRVRHEQRQLRLGPAGTDAVVAQHQIRCTHFDAFRFFTPDARPLNTLDEPTRQNQPMTEQPGCLHANMDLYKWATKLAPYGDSALLLDAFELARDVRTLDMRASPYDLSDLGYEPVRIEEPAGKSEYVASQRRFAERAARIRTRLCEDIDRVLAVVARDYSRPDETQAGSADRAPTTASAAAWSDAS